MVDNKNPQQAEKDEYSAYLTLGFVFGVIGLATLNMAFFVIGIVFFVLGSTNNPDPFNMKNWFNKNAPDTPTPAPENPEPFTRDDLKDNK